MTFKQNIGASINKIIIELIKVSKIPLILLTISLLWSSDFNIKNLTSLIEGFKYNKDGSIEVKLVKQQALALKEKIDNNETIPTESINELLNSINAFESLNNSTYIKGTISLNNNEIINIFGSEELKIYHEYKISKNIIIT